MNPLHGNKAYCQLCGLSPLEIQKYAKTGTLYAQVYGGSDVEKVNGLLIDFVLEEDTNKWNWLCNIQEKESNGIHTEELENLWRSVPEGRFMRKMIKRKNEKDSIEEIVGILSDL